MINLLKITTCENNAFYVNPVHISLFTPTTAAILQAMGHPPNQMYPGSTLIMVGALTLQIRDTPKDIINGLIRLRDSNSRYLLGLRKNMDKEEWQSDEDEEEDFEDEP